MDALVVLGGRYRLVRSLGRGTSGEVFAAEDLKLGAVVALKKFHVGSPAGLLELKREFRLLTEVSEPGLVKFFDLVVNDQEAFFTMEMVDGVDFLTYARTVARPRLLAALTQIAVALSGLHHAGIIHRDLKPANIYVGRGGDVRLLDFGLAGVVGNGSGGTLAYMAPEMIVKREATPASDWYAFGTIIYEVLSGRLPASGDLAERLLRIQRRRFPKLDELDPSVDPHLAEVVWKLLDPVPATRARFENIAAALDPASVSRRRQLRGLVGRSEELAWLHSRRIEAESGGVRTARIEATSGVGKSALVREFLASLGPHWLVLSSRARPQESVPLRALDAILDQLVSLVPTAAVDALPSSFLQAFPVFARSLSSAERAIRVDAPEARREAQSALVNMLRGLADDRPITIWIDDIQWADDESLSVLELLVAANARILVLLTGRPDPSLERRAVWLAHASMLRLPHLGEGDARQLLSLVERDAPLSAETIAMVIAEARGNAFMLEFFARHVPPTGGDVETALRAVLDGLVPSARVLFECIAIAEQPLPLVAVGHVLTDRTVVRDHVAVLASRGLISVDDHERVVAYHDKLRDTANLVIDAFRRRACHDALASALIETSQAVELQIPHLEGAGRTAEAGKAALAAARSAASRYAFEIAAAYFGKALAHTDLVPLERAAVLEDLGTNLASAGRGRDAADRYREAESLYGLEGRADFALRSRQRAAIALLRSGALDAGREMLASSLDELGEGLPRSPILAAVVEAIRVGLASRDRPARAINARERSRLEMLFTTAVTLSMYDPIVANALTLRFVRQVLAHGPSPWTTRALSLEASFLSALGGRYRKRARERVRALRDRLGHAPTTYDRAWTDGTAGSTAWLAGEIQDCLDNVTLARTSFRSAPETSAHELALIEAFRLPALSMLGRFHEAVDGAKDTIALAEARGDEFALLPCLHGHITLAYLATGRREDAERFADRALEIGARGTSPMPAYHQAWSRAILALHSRRGGDGLEELRRAWPRLRKLGMLRLEAVVGDLRYLRGRCALAASDRQDAAEQVRWLRRSTLGYAPAAADAIDAQLLADKDPRAARKRLAAAVAAFSRLGLEPDRDALTRWSMALPPGMLDSVYLPSAGRAALGD